MLAGIVLGEDEGLTDELRDDFKASGLYHLLAVSGQNITFLALGVLGLAWLLGIPRLARRSGGDRARSPRYVLAVGWQPSVVRAGVAGGLASLAWLLSRPRDRWHFLALGAAVLLAWTPASLLEPGFQLSFAAVGSIFLLLPRLRRGARGLPAHRTGSERRIAVSTACGAATAPILWLQFGSVPVYSLPANALVTPAIGPLLGIALVGSLIEPVLPTAALALGWLNGWLAAYIAACARVIGGLAVRAGRLRDRGLPAARDAGRAAAPAAPAALAPAAGGRVRRGRRCRRCSPGSSFRRCACRRRPGCGSRSSTSARATRSCSRSPRARCSSTRGRRRRTSRGQLRGLGVRRLAALVLTHPQRDHIGGAEDVLSRLAVDRVLDPRLAVSGPFERAALAEAADRGRAGRRDARGRRLPARAPPAPRALAGRAGHRERGSEPARRSSCSRPTARSTRC